jgi:hypothetical protein
MLGFLVAMMYLCGKYKYGEKKLELNGREERSRGAKGDDI